MVLLYGRIWFLGFELPSYNCLVPDSDRLESLSSSKEPSSPQLSRVEVVIWDIRVEVGITVTVKPLLWEFILPHKALGGGLALLLGSALTCISGSDSFVCVIIRVSLAVFILGSLAVMILVSFTSGSGNVKCWLKESGVSVVLLFPRSKVSFQVGLTVLCSIADYAIYHRIMTG